MATARVRFPRFNSRPAGERAPLPLSPAAIAIRENLAERRQGLAELEPRALDLAARVLAGIHEATCGHMTELRGSCSPEYRRRQLLGRDGLAVEDVAYLALHAPEAVTAGLAAMAAALDQRLEPCEPDGDAPVPVALAHAVQSSGALVAGIVARLQDGLTGDEAVECDALLHDFKEVLASLEAALHTEAMGKTR